MAATPPLQITSTPQTPPTPLHGAAYDRPTRQSARIKQRVISQQSQSTPEPTPRSKPSVATPSSRLSRQSQSPRSTPKKPSKRVQVISPTSPDAQSSPPTKPTKQSNSRLQPFLSSTTTMVEGIPTPIKTPKKKHVPNASAAARALFQDANADTELIAPSPKRGRKNKRYNGFSLESFKAEEETGGRIQIFTDNRDKVPELDTSELNPFLDPPANGDGSRAKRLAGGSKRRKVSGEKRVDPQVKEAIKNDDGMVYVFRGKKVYRRFDDTGEEEEEIDAEDLGLLEHTADGAARVKPLKTLTRRSIKPTRLFQTETQKRSREREREEEALTDIDDQAAGDCQETLAESSHAAARSRKSATKFEDVDKPRKASPFDSWPRVKSGGRLSSTSKGQKRTASDALDDEPVYAAAAENTRARKTRA